jgi:hypothetical protein
MSSPSRRFFLKAHEPMEQRSLDSILQAHAADLQKVSEGLEAIVRTIRELPPTPDVIGQPMHHPYRACKRFFTQLQKVERRLEEAKQGILERQFNAYWTGKLRRRYDLSSYEKKKEVAKEINADLRHYGYAIRHPESASPCMVLAVGSPDGTGRYVLADRLTKKRSHTCNTLLDLFPIGLVPEPRRREGFLEKDEASDEAPKE